MPSFWQSCCNIYEQEPEEARMRSLTALIWIFTLVGCGKMPKSKSSSSDDIDTISNPAITAGELELHAARDYNPDQWEHGQLINYIKGWFDVPAQIDVTQGESATGWVSLYVGTRKFCYQGSSASNGTKFILKHEKTAPDVDCESTLSNFAFDRKVFIGQGDSIKLSVNGGGCGQNCYRTEVRALIIPRQE